MKILKNPPTSDEPITSIVANQGCSVCPFCGTLGIASYTHAEWADGLGNNSRRLRTDLYICTCGGEWESEPYEIN